MPKTKKQKTISRWKLVKQADSVFSTYIRLRDSDKKGMVTCPLCWAKLPWKKSQNMHFIGRACRYYRYDEINCHAWCMRCNVMLNWNYIEYTRYMQKTYWIEYVDNMIAESKKIHKFWKPELLQVIDTYSEKIIKFSKLLTL